VGRSARVRSPRRNPVEESLLNRHERALREWWRWRRARFQREREDALIELWRLSEPEVRAAVKKLAEKLSESRGAPGSISFGVWLWMHGKTYEEVHAVAFPGIWRAANGFDPAKGTFQTYAYYHILATIRRDLLCGSRPDEGSAEPYAPAVHDVPDHEASPDALTRAADLSSLMIAIPEGSLVGQIYTETNSLDSEYLEDTAASVEMLLSEQLPCEKQRRLEIVRAMLIAQATRAADREDRMVTVSDLAQMLQAKKYRQHMKKKWHSNAQLSREFDVSDKTIKEWLRACEEEGIAADDLSPGALDRIARIMTPRRGPKAGRKQVPPSD
jgi:hypothetical protein